MSNVLCIEPTEFKNVRTGNVSFGVRVYDNYEKCYINTWDSIPEDDEELFDLVMQDEEAKQIINSYIAAKEDEIGLDDESNDEDDINEATIFIGDVAYSKSDLM